jgi:hypothetical protein
MSENKNLVARNKFVSKLQKKITEMSQSLQLLAKVDDKLFLSQSGGSGLHTFGVSLANLEARAIAWQKATTNTTALQSKLSELESAIQIYQTRLNNIIDSLGLPIAVVSDSALDKYIMMDVDGYEAAKKVFEAAYELITKPTTSKSEYDTRLADATNGLSALIRAFNTLVDSNTIITKLTATEKNAIKDELKNKVDIITTEAVTKITGP